MAVVNSFVVPWLIGPHRSSGVNFNRAHADKFTWSTSREFLDLHHGPNRWRQVFQDLLDRCVVYRLDGRCLAGTRTSPLQSRYRLESHKHLGTYEFVLGRPAKQPFDSADAVIDVRSGPTEVDHMLAHGFQRQRSESTSLCGAMQSPKRAQSKSDIVDLRTAWSKVDLRTSVISQQQLVDAQVDLNLAGGDDFAAEQPFSDEAIIFLPALRTAMGTKIVIPAVDRDNG